MPHDQSSVCGGRILTQVGRESHRNGVVWCTSSGMPLRCGGSQQTRVVEAVPCCAIHEAHTVALGSHTCMMVHPSMQACKNNALS